MSELFPERFQLVRGNPWDFVSVVGADITPTEVQERAFKAERLGKHFHDHDYGIDGRCLVFDCSGYSRDHDNGSSRASDIRSNDDLTGKSEPHHFTVHNDVRSQNDLCRICGGLETDLIHFVI